MHWLTAIIRPFKLGEVYERLIDEGVGGMTVTEVKGFGLQKGKIERFRGNNYSTDFVPKIKIEMAIPQTDLERIIDAIVESSRTGKPGDGKIFVNRIDQSNRIRTGESDLNAL